MMLLTYPPNLLAGCPSLNYYAGFGERPRLSVHISPITHIPGSWCVRKFIFILLPIALDTFRKCCHLRGIERLITPFVQVRPPLNYFMTNKQHVRMITAWAFYDGANCHFRSDYKEGAVSRCGEGV